MKKKVCVFVDGENFRHSIVELFSNFDPIEYLPQKANWGQLFDWLVQEAFPEGERLRTYWYVIEMTDFWPYMLPDPERDTDQLKNLLEKDDSFKQEIQTCSPGQLKTKLSELRNSLIERQRKFKGRFDGWRRIQDGISQKWSRIEFRRAGAITYNLFEKKLGSEKAVDVKLATDLIMLRDIYDVALIVSGDQDYVPAVKVVKHSGKIVSNIVFKTRSGKLLPGGAKRLNVETDSCIEIDYAKLVSHINI